jgi:uncharacterized SAM-binding protein YcdF (DUF218 family)
LGMLLEIVLVVTPLTDKLYMWLVVTGQPVQADYIVCLGGRDERLVWTAQAFNRKFAPQVIVSNANGASVYMKRLLSNCGVPADKIIIDDHSHTTAEHPFNIAALPGIDIHHDRFLIVTDHEHSRRAADCFRRGGFQHFTFYFGPAPLHDWENERGHWKWRILFLPRIAYEYAALLQYWWQGKL